VANLRIQTAVVEARHQRRRHQPHLRSRGRALGLARR
jgi:hypothetical protein